MTRPQQPEIERSGRTPVDEDAVQGTDHPRPDRVADPPRGPVPEANRPGHHPDREQDKPEALGGAGHGQPE
jgi:hypothetical protein